MQVALVLRLTTEDRHPGARPKPRSGPAGWCLGLLLALAEAGSLAAQTAKVIQLRAADASGADHVDVIDDRGCNRENAFHALAEADLANCYCLRHAGTVFGYDRAFESLGALFVAFLDPDVDADGVAGTELGNIGTRVLCGNLGQGWMVHLKLFLLRIFSVSPDAAGRSVPPLPACASARSRHDSR